MTADRQDKMFSITPVMLAAALAGAAAVVVSVFLPLVETPPEFPQGVQKNSLIQNSPGAAFRYALIAVVAAGIAYRCYSQQRRGWGLLVAGVVLLFALADGANDDLFTLYAVTSGDQLDLASNSVRSGAAIALYVAGAGGALIAIAGIMVRRAEPAERAAPSVTPSRPTKDCPQCAESVLAPAKVCRYCGHHFESWAA